MVARVLQICNFRSQPSGNAQLPKSAFSLRTLTP
jgi:hypothetical protein